MDSKQSKQKGGFILDLLFGKKPVKLHKRRRSSGTRKAGPGGRRRIQKKFDSIYEKAVDSEETLIRSYEDLAKVSKVYYEDYATHLENLITLDDINGMAGLQSTFKNVLIKDVFKGYDQIDRSNPLLLRNYLITEHTQPKYFRKEHLMQQIRYALSTNFALKDSILIAQYDIRMENNKAIITYKMLNGETHERTAPIDAEFNISIPVVVADLRDIIITMKKAMDYEIEVADDFELKDIAIEVPGLQFANEEDTLERKLRDLKTSIKIDDAIPDMAESANKSTEKPIVTLNADQRTGLLRIESIKRVADVGKGAGSPADKLGFGEGKLEGVSPKELDLKAELGKIATQGATITVKSTKSESKAKSKHSSTKKASYKKPASYKKASYKRNSVYERCSKLGEEACRSDKTCFYNRIKMKCTKNTALLPRT